MPVSRTVTRKRAESCVLGSTSHRHLYLAAVGELDRVADEIHEDLTQPTRIAKQGRRHGFGNVVDELQSLVVGPQRQRLEHVRDQIDRRELDVLDCELARLDLREVQHIVDDRQQRTPRRQDEREILALLGESSSVSRTSSVMPSMPFSGVRISWLMLARNSLLAPLAASAASFALRNSRSAALAAVTSRITLTAPMCRSSSSKRGA